MRILVRKKVLITVGVSPGSSSTWAAERGSNHYGCTTANLAAAHGKISAVSECQYSGDCLVLRDCLTAV